MIEILTVSYYSGKMLYWNKLHFDKLNPSLKYDWHIVDNRFGEDKISKEFIRHDGVPQPTENYSIPNQKGNIYIGSIHHGLSINHGLQYLDWNGIVIILDPDFVFLSPLDDILQRIETENLWFFGACYTNQNKNYIRNFPCAYCLFINTHFVCREDLDFSIGYDEEITDFYPDVGYKVMHKFKNNPECKYYGISKNMDDVFFYKSGKFGVHLSAKPYLYGPKHKLDKLKNEIGI